MTSSDSQGGEGSMCCVGRASPSAGAAAAVGGSMGALASRLRGVRIGYVPVRPDCSWPTDRRLWCHYARVRDVSYELIREPGDHNLAIVPQQADVTVWRRAPRRTKVVFILDNAYLSGGRSDLKAVLRGAAKFAVRQHRWFEGSYVESLRRMCARADAVVCGSEEQRQLVQPYSQRVYVLPAFHAEIPMAPKRDFTRGATLNVAWEGIGNNVVSFRAISDALREVASRHDLAIHLVTDLEYHWALNGIGRRSTIPLARRSVGIERTHLYQWNERMLGPICTACDLALIPIPLDKPFWVGKPENKLLLLWRMGLPVIAADTPAYRRAMAGAGLDLVCGTQADWVKAIEGLADDEEARRHAGERGLAYVTTEYAEERLLARWDRMLADVMGSQG